MARSRSYIPFTRVIVMFICASIFAFFWASVPLDPANKFPFSTDKKSYSVYSRESITARELDFQCHTDEGFRAESSRSAATARTNDKRLRKYRLALSCNAEYGNLFQKFLTFWENPNVAVKSTTASSKSFFIT